MRYISVHRGGSKFADWYNVRCVLQEEDVVKKLSEGAGTKSKLPKPVQELIKMIFDVESMKKAMVEFEVFCPFQLGCKTQL